MGSSDALSSIVSREVRPLVRRVSLAFLLGFFVLVAVPASAAIVLALSGGPRFVAFGLLAIAILGFLFALLVLPVAVVGVAAVLGLVAVSEVGSYVTDQRIALYRRVEAVEASRWWGSIVRPSAQLGFLDPRTAAERFDAELSQAKASYVAGDLTEVQLERELERVFGIEPDALARGEFDAARSSPTREHHDDRRATTSIERTAR